LFENLFHFSLQAICPRASIAFKSTPHLKTAFVRKILSVDQALTDGDMDQARELYLETIEQYGTHYAKNAIVGSR